jgi:hypothetical protein
VAPRQPRQEATGSRFRAAARRVHRRRDPTSGDRQPGYAPGRTRAASRHSRRERTARRERPARRTSLRAIANGRTRTFACLPRCSNDRTLRKNRHGEPPTARDRACGPRFVTNTGGIDRWDTSLPRELDAPRSAKVILGHGLCPARRSTATAGQQAMILSSPYPRRPSIEWCSYLVAGRDDGRPGRVGGMHGGTLWSESGTPRRSLIRPAEATYGRQ